VSSTKIENPGGLAQGTMQSDDVSILRIRTPPPDNFFDAEESKLDSGLHQKTRVAMVRLICLIATAAVTSMILYLVFRE